MQHYHCHARKRKKVTFNDVVQVRLIVEEQFEFHKLLTQ